MFLHMFSKEEKTAFLQLAYQLAIADGHEAAEELGMLEECAREMGFDGLPELKLDADLDALLDVFQAPESRRALLLELLRLAHADENYAEFERLVIDRVALDFGLDQRFVRLGSEWARMAIALERQGLLLLDLPFQA